jgi:NADPH:quinone reductase
VGSFEEQALPMFADGRLKPIVDHVYPLADAAAAHRRIIDRDQFGKLVLTVP